MADAENITAAPPAEDNPLEKRRIAERDSYAPLVVRLALPIDENWPKGSTVTVSAQNYFRSANLTFSVEGGWTGTIVLVDRDHVLAKALLISGMSATVALQFDWDTPDHNLSKTPWFKGHITLITPEYDDAGLLLSLELVVAKAAGTVDSASIASPEGGSPVEGSETTSIGGQNRELHGGLREFVLANSKVKDGELYTINREKGVVYFKMAAWSPPFVVEAICKFWGWEHSINMESIRFPENVTGLAMNAGETSQQFIRRAVLPLAVSFGLPEHFVFFFDPYDQDKVIFAPPSQVDRVLPTHRYVYRQDVAGNVVSFTPTDSSYAVSMRGATDATAFTVDTGGGLPGEMIHDSQLGVQDADTSTKPRNEFIPSAPPPTPGSPVVPNRQVNPDTLFRKDLSYQRVFGRTPREASLNAQALFSNARFRALGGTLEVKGTHLVRALDHILVLYYAVNGDLVSPLSGMFKVIVIEHSVDSGGWRTTFTLTRSGFSEEYALNPATTDAVNGVQA